jgi:two-component system chemotaxis response regulator CheB
MRKRGKLRALVIDDSAFDRRTIAEMLQSSSGVVVVGTAEDGVAGLELALALRPDVITLDLRMPRMDGFAFLRCLAPRAPIPVIVMSGYSRQEDVFRAMELGAFDFLAKPGKHFSDEAAAVREALLAKVEAVRLARQEPLRPAGLPKILLLGASTGGPPALQRLLCSLPGDLSLCAVLAQHMPARFTRAFAERLDKISAFEVREARDGDALVAGRALVAPGGRQLRLEGPGSGPIVSLSASAPGEKYVPSVDALFESAARLVGARALGVLLTGMGNDGCAGLAALRSVGARTIAESEESAVIFGMPKEAIESGAAERALPLQAIAAAIIKFARGGA